MTRASYQYLKPNEPLPAGKLHCPYRAVLVVESQVEPAWRRMVSEWLIRTGCLYMLAWGEDCSLWDDAVDVANLAAFAPEPIPDDRFVFTTWHDHETLDEVFWFAEHGAWHPDVDLEYTVLIHIAERPVGDEMLKAFQAAQASVD